MNYTATATNDQDEVLAKVSALTLESLEEKLYKLDQAEQSVFMCPVDPQERNACESCE